MNSLQESYLKSLNPTVSVKVEDINKGTIPENILSIINIALSKARYKTFLDIKNGVIYIGKRV